MAAASLGTVPGAGTGRRGRPRRRPDRQTRLAACPRQRRSPPLSMRVPSPRHHTSDCAARHREQPAGELTRLCGFRAVLSLERMESWHSAGYSVCLRAWWRTILAKRSEIIGIDGPQEHPDALPVPGQPPCAASSMRAATSGACEISERWLAPSETACAFMRLARKRCRSGLIVRSSSDTA